MVNFIGVESLEGAKVQWLRNGQAAFVAIEQAIRSATHSVCLESYIYKNDAIGRRIRDALIEAAGEGVEVQVMVDAWGSQDLSEEFWWSLVRAGGEFRWFNPLKFSRFAIRNHRKLLVCDNRTAIVGGFNIAQEYWGDGVHTGWLDLGVMFEGPMVRDLRLSFDQLFQLSDFRHQRFARWKRSKDLARLMKAEGDVLLNAPGFGRRPIKRALYRDLDAADDVRIISAYFLPPWRIRRSLQRIVRRGGRVQLILAGKTDVPISQAATRSLYTSLLRSGVEIYEYQPQILHAKLYLLNGHAYVGSSNLDKRSLSINYELLVRLSDPDTVQEGQRLFEHFLTSSERIIWQRWKESRSWWTRLQEKLAYFFLVHLDPYLARHQLKMLH